jgi:hypothetical protein
VTKKLFCSSSSLGMGLTVECSGDAWSYGWCQQLVSRARFIQDVAAVAEGTLVAAGGVMAFGGCSGGEVARPCVSLCVVAGGNGRCGSGSCVGPAGHLLLDGMSRQRGGRHSSPEKKWHVSLEKEGVRHPAVCRPVHGSRCGSHGSCVGHAGRLCSTGVCHQRRRP